MQSRKGIGRMALEEDEKHLLHRGRNRGLNQIIKTFYYRGKVIEFKTDVAPAGRRSPCWRKAGSSAQYASNEPTRKR